jgi:hypothetical protein
MDYLEADRAGIQDRQAHEAPMTQPWNAAKAASKRPLPKPRKTHGPVGEKQDIASHFVDNVDRHYLGEQEFGTCKGCGYHVCSCAPKATLRHFDPTRFGDMAPLNPERSASSSPKASQHWDKMSIADELDKIELTPRQQAINLITTGSMHGAVQSGSLSKGQQITTLNTAFGPIKVVSDPNHRGPPIFVPHPNMPSGYEYRLPDGRSLVSPSDLRLPK